MVSGGEVDGTCWKLLSGMAVAVVAEATAIGILWRALLKSQNGRIKDQEDHTAVLEEIKRRLPKKGGNHGRQIDGE